MAKQTIKSALIQVGGMSSPSKMPAYSYSLPASACNVGSKLRKVPGSACASCYACKHAYVWPGTINAMERRLNAIYSPEWIDNMAFIINKRAENNKEFRWHDSGDLQSLAHLERIVAVVKATPTVNHWLPSKEYAVIREYLKLHPEGFPSNLCVRVSAPMVGQILKDSAACSLPTSSINVADSFQCPVKNGSEGCDTYACRACWSNDCKNVNYRKH